MRIKSREEEEEKEGGSNSINKVMEGDRNLIMRLVGKMAWKIQSVNVLK